MNSDYQSEYLPKYFWYHGMNKIKAGKGYRDGRPVGPISGPCPECDGQIISIKMNTSARGFETTSEKVCDTCGLVIEGAFQTLEPHQPYKCRYFKTHEEWIKHMTPSPKSNDDVAWDAEIYEHVNGTRMNTHDDVGYGDGDAKYNNLNDHNKRIAKAIWRLNKTPASKKVPREVSRKREYNEIAADYANMFDVRAWQLDDIIYRIDHIDGLMKMPYKADDIIMCVVLIVKSLYVNNGYMATLKRQIPMWNSKYKTMYKAIRSKMNV